MAGRTQVGDRDWVVRVVRGHVDASGAPIAFASAGVEQGPQIEIRRRPMLGDSGLVQTLMAGLAAQGRLFAAIRVGREDDAEEPTLAVVLKPHPFQ